MSASGKSFYLTTPIYYVNDAPHIGHAYTTVAGDLLTRWHRQRGESVWFLTGTDEHGQKVLRTAEANGVTPQEWCDRLVRDAWLPVWKHLEIANDDFIRTTESRHMERVQRFMQDLMEKGFIYEAPYEGLYCVGCEEFKLPGDLVDGNCKIHSKPVEVVHETNWFFKLSQFAKPLLEHYRKNPSACEPESARNEVISFLEGSVEDLSISRSTFDWGIPVPWDPKQVIYVWFDALLNYATAVGLSDETGSDGSKFFNQTWPADVHLVGKDILRFHAVIWPAMLMAAGLPTPKKVFAHGWLLVGGEKMSKTTGNVVNPLDLIDDIGLDGFRYYVLADTPYGQDGDFTYEGLISRYNSDLANNLGNLVNRTLNMTTRFAAGVVPAAEVQEGRASAPTAGAPSAAPRSSTPLYVPPPRELQAQADLARAHSAFFRATSPATSASARPISTASACRPRNGRWSG